METVTNILVPTKDQVNAESQTIFNQLESQLGFVPNMYATIGYSSNALSNILSFSGEAGKGTFSKREIEAIKLAVSDVNNCTYCKAAHTAMAKMNGFSDEEALKLRKASIEDTKLNALTTLAREVSEKSGHVSEESRQRFFEAGFGEKALIDFVAVITAVTFTNYVYGLTQIPVDFPEVG
ncbi:carboxymuconolactone decarboxylase family protein [Crocinitomicaceae bacterium]|nr:carboxymuconolactone decarboxylase family protein [Crocinitomicaceae bacterium]